MKRIWHQSTGRARTAIISGCTAHALFFLPFLLIWLLPIWDLGGVFFMLLWPFSLFFLIRATANSIAASRAGHWWRPDGGKIFACSLYGLPVFFTTVMVGLLFRR
jgi:hypothetical protein